MNEVEVMVAIVEMNLCWDGESRRWTGLLEVVKGQQG